MKSWDDSNPKRRKLKMLKELIRSNSYRKIGNDEHLSPTEEALREFEKENGYDFLDMTNNTEVRKEHNLKQLQKKDNNDNDFLEKYQDHQGDI